MFSKVKKLHKYENLRKYFAAESQEFKFSLHLLQRKSNPSYVFNLSGSVVASSDLRSIELLTQYGTAYFEILSFVDDEIFQIESAIWSDVICIRSRESLIAFKMRDNNLVKLPIKCSKILLFTTPLSNDNNTTFCFIFSSGILNIMNLSLMKLCSYTYEFKNEECKFLLQNPRNPNQLLIGLESIVYLYDVCKMHILTKYSIRDVQSGCFSPLGTQICVATSTDLLFFSRESNEVNFNYATLNVKYIDWFMDVDDYLFVISNNISIYKYKNNLVKIREVQGNSGKILFDNAFWKMGQHYYLIDNNIISQRLIEFGLKHDFSGVPHFFNVSSNFLKKLTVENLNLPFELNLIVDEIDMAFPDLIVYQNEKGLSFYQYFTSSGILSKCKVNYEKRVDLFTIYKDNLIIFDKEIQIYSLDNDNWNRIKTYPVQASPIGTTEEALIAFSSNFKIIFLSDVVLEYSVKVENIFFVKRDIFLFVSGNKTQVVKFDNGTFKVIYEKEFVAKKCVFVEARNLILLQLDELICIEKDEVFAIKNDIFDGLLSLQDIVFGVKVSTMEITLFEIFGSRSKSFPIPLKSEIFVFDERIYIYGASFLYVLSEKDFFRISCNADIPKRKLPKQGPLSYVKSLFKSDFSRFEETEFEEDPQFYYDCLADLHTLFSKQMSVQTNENLQFEELRNVLVERGERLEELNSKFNDLELGAKNLLKLARNLK
eukprot:NODE_68_length_25399_cov_0.885771.p3 type:complete len:712 gc:universal NODE_68_length_25399_cov_0.885771:10835-12970(+)